MAGAGAATRVAARAAGGKTGVGKLISGLGGVGGLLSIGSSVAGILGGIGQKRRAKKMLDNAIDPGLKAYEENAAKAEQLARQGMPAQEYNLASTNIQRGTQAGLRQLGRMSNPFAGIAGLKRSEDDAFSRLDASNAAARRQNIIGAMQAKRDLNNMQLQRYNDEINQANALLGAGQQNIAGGLGSLGQFGMMQSLYGGKPTTDPTKTITTPTSTPTNTPTTPPNSSTFNLFDPYGINQLFNQYQGIGGVVGRKFGGINPQTGRPYGQ